jgi:transcriptional regulator with XRE-family HTH domain
MTTSRKAFGQRVLRARLEMGSRMEPPRQVTQEEVGSAVGASGQAVGTWETGKKVPSLETITKLAFVLGVRAAWLAFGEEPMRVGGSGEPPTSRRSQRRA